MPRVSPADACQDDLIGYGEKQASTVLLDNAVSLRGQERPAVELPSLPPIPESAARSHSSELASALGSVSIEAARTRPVSPPVASANAGSDATPIDWKARDWKVSEHVMRRFLRRVHAGYCRNPYHNAEHAADVTQGMAIMMRHGLSEQLTKLERMGLLLAAAVHDLGHPGVSNQFLVATRDHWALVYNDLSVNENMHISKAFLIAHEEQLFEGLTAEEYTQMRQIMISVVLSTDMFQHFSLLAVWNAKVEAQPDVWAWRDRMLLLVMTMHLADIVNPARPVNIAVKWGTLIVEECMQQGDLERQRGLPASPMCQPVCTPAVPQLRFIKMFLAPTLEACRSLAPTFIDMAIDTLHKSVCEWEAILARDAPARRASESGGSATDQSGGTSPRSSGDLLKRRDDKSAQAGAALPNAAAQTNGRANAGSSDKSNHAFGAASDVGAPGKQSRRGSLSQKRGSSLHAGSRMSTAESLGSAPSGFFCYQLHSADAAASLTLNELPPARRDSGQAGAATPPRVDSRNNSGSASLSMDR